MMFEYLSYLLLVVLVVMFLSAAIRILTASIGAYAPADER